MKDDPLKILLTRGSEDNHVIDKAYLVHLLYDDLDNISWWKESTRDAYREVGLKMLEAGMKVGDIVPLLGKLYHATGEEYGN